ALLTAFTTLIQSCLGSCSGFLVEALGWPGFFVLTAFASLPALALLSYQKIPYLSFAQGHGFKVKNLTERIGRS
ncbi:MAG: hypothetical protein ACRCTK_02520, partial [Alphaproteobacteria bacterium]